MFNRNLLTAILLAAVSSTALALDADQPAKDRNAGMSSEKGLAQQASEWEAQQRELYHRGSATD